MRRARMGSTPQKWQVLVVTACFAVASVLGPASNAFAQKGKGKSAPQAFSVLPITITGVTVANGQLVANGLLGANPFQLPLLLSSHTSDGPCPILDLQVGAIDLTLLGLRVQTSNICLEVTAVPGGGLLGNLLCEVANLLQGGTTLPEIITLLTARGDLERFLGGLTSMLDSVFDAITANNTLAGATCSVLSLQLGPIELNLLGLVVELDNCANGPVTVDVTAIQGGGLLGDLLCSLADLLNNRGPATAIRNLLWQISQALAQLLG
jgi:hypothetical protein